MKLRGPLARLFHFSAEDRSHAGVLISAPLPMDATEPALPYLRFEVKFIHQAHVNLCGDACVNMLLSAKGRAHLPRLDKNPRGPFTGLSGKEILQRLAAANLKACTIPSLGRTSWSADEIAERLRAHGPIICNGSTHSILLSSIHEETVFVHDPWRGPNRSLSLDEFNRYLDWKREDFMIAVLK